MRDARHPQSCGADSMCGKHSEHANPQGQRRGSVVVSGWRLGEVVRKFPTHSHPASLGGDRDVPERDGGGSGGCTLQMYSKAPNCPLKKSAFYGM